MAKSKTLKRIVTKSGEVRYYQGGKRLSKRIGQRRFIKQNPNVALYNLSESEQRALKASKKAKKQWKFKNLANIQPVYIELLKRFGVLSDDETLPNNDLYYATDGKGNRLFNNFSDIVKYIDDKAKKNPLAFQWCNEVGLPNYRGRTFETFANNKLTSIVDIVDLLDSEGYKRYRFNVIDENGELHEGRIKALLALRDYEIRIGSKIQSLVQNSAFMRFCYDYKVDFKKKTLTIDLTDTKPDKDLEEYIDESGGTGAKQKLFVGDKFKDVEIEIDFS